MFFASDSGQAASSSHVANAVFATGVCKVKPQGRAVSGGMLLSFSALSLFYVTFNHVGQLSYLLYDCLESWIDRRQMMHTVGSNETVFPGFGHC